MLKKYEGDTIMKTFLQTQSKRELFSKHNVLMSRIYSALAKKLPINPLGAKDAAGAAVAGRAVSQDVTKMPAPAIGGIGAAVGAEADSLTSQ
jgi:hypothetical protein